MKIVRTATEYRIEMRDAQMQRLLELESHNQPHPLPGDQLLYKKLALIDGVDKVDYEGHFGAAVFLRIAVDHDNDATHKAILRVIHNHIR